MCTLDASIILGRSTRIPARRENDLKLPFERWGQVPQQASSGLIDEDLHQSSLGLIDEGLTSSIKRLDQELADLVVDIRRGSSRKMLLPSS
jgi:hypothetical protein